MGGNQRGPRRTTIFINLYASVKSRCKPCKTFDGQDQGALGSSGQGFVLNIDGSLGHPLIVAV